MDKDSKNKLKDVLSAIDPVEFKWDDMSVETGFTAQEVDSTIIDLSGSCDTITISPIDISTISIGATGNNSSYFVSGSANGGYSFASQPTISINSDNNKNYIQTDKHKIDLDELGEMMETLKKRLLILTPNFEMHEKYPMLKELYDEYKAMEKLLSGPDIDEQ